MTYHTYFPLYFWHVKSYHVQKFILIISEYVTWSRLVISHIYNNMNKEVAIFHTLSYIEIRYNLYAHGQFRIEIIMIKKMQWNS